MESGLASVSWSSPDLKEIFQSRSPRSSQAYTEPPPTASIPAPLETPSGSSLPGKIGGVIGGIFALILVGVAIYLYRRRACQRRPIKKLKPQSKEKVHWLSRNFEVHGDSLVQELDTSRRLSTSHDGNGLSEPLGPELGCSLQASELPA